jgi:DNA-binding beta-propeller fold protein YncE
MIRRLALCAFLLVSFGALATATHAADGPRFAVDPAWPKPLPNNWLIGQIGGLFVDQYDHVWVFQRPRSLTDDERGAALTPPISICCKPAPPVLEFDREGNLIQAWGGPGPGYDWPQMEHGIAVDREGFVYLGGNGTNDGAILKFTRSGKFVAQFGRPGPPNSTDTTKFGQPADIWVDEAAHELYIADGYGNHRVIVIDKDTGAFKRMWGAYGKPPRDDGPPKYDPAAPPSPTFGNPVHCVLIARDGLVYVCDRSNDRIQVFHQDGSFVKEAIYLPATLRSGSVWDMDFWPRDAQTYLVNADGENNQVRILRRDTLQVVSSFGRSGRNAGEFHWVHVIAVDSKGDIYTGEVDNAKRLQKFRYLGGDQ